jgi:signal transduction histidine kinase
VDKRDGEMETAGTDRERGGSWTGGKLALIFGLLLALLAINTALAVRSVLAMESSEQPVIHSHTVLTAIETFEATLLDAETGQRGYILTGDRTYLTPYLNARQHLDGELAQLQQLTADNPAQQARLAALQPLVANRLLLLDQTIQLQQDGQSQLALQYVSSGQGMRDMDTIRRLVEQMDAGEVALLAQRNADAQASLTQATISILIAALADAILVAAVFILIRRALVRREAVARERARLLADEREARRTAEAAVRVRDQFLSIASHELNTPLTTLKAMADYVTARQGTGEDEAVDAATAAGSDGMDGVDGVDGMDGADEAKTLLRLAVARLERLVRDLLDVARIESGSLGMRIERRDLAALCRRAAEEQRIAGHDVRVELPEEPVYAEVDSDRIAQVLGNLLGNAIKYGGSDNPVVLSVVREHSEVVCCVHDEGPGIPADELPRLFERYYQAPSVHVQSGSQLGLGVGLYLCREIVERHGGRIWGQSEPGTGSRFSFALPLATDTVSDGGDVRYTGDMGNVSGVQRGDGRAAALVKEVTGHGAGTGRG